jgi:hypothetical protein
MELGGEALDHQEMTVRLLFKIIEPIFKILEAILRGWFIHDTRVSLAERRVNIGRGR